MRHGKSMENLEKLEKLIGKFPANNWEFYCKKLGWSKSTFYDYAGTLQNQNKIYSKNGLWYPKSVEVEQLPKEKAQTKSLGILLNFFEKREAKKNLNESRIFKHEALPIVESIYNRHRFSWLEPLIKHDKEINKKLDELEKKS